MLFSKIYGKSKKYLAVSLAELMIVLMLISIIATFLIITIENSALQTKELLIKFDTAYTNLSNVLSKVMVNQDPNSTWKTDAEKLSNISCKDASGNNITNRSLCLRTAMLDNSSNIQACSSDIECFPDYTNLSTQLTEYFPNTTEGETASIKLPEGANALISYMDSECQLQIPINRKSRTETEYVKGCGVMVIDANGTDNPNNLIIDDTEYVDRFLVAITKNGLVKSNFLSALVCEEGTTWDSKSKKCKTATVCPYNMDKVNTMEGANDDDNIIKTNIESDNCYDVKCRYTGSVTPAGVCPASCNAGEGRYGGLWVSEGGSLAEGTPKECCIPIYDVRGLNNINNNLAGNYCLMADLTVDSSTFSTSIGSLANPFTGNFYGNGHTISGLTVSLFEKVEGAGKKIENLGLTGLNVTGYGALARHVNGMDLSSIFGTGNVTSETPVSGSIGGLVGYSETAATFNNLYYQGNITVSDTGTDDSLHVFGISGLVGGSLDNTHNNHYFDGNIILTKDAHPVYIGGVYGYSIRNNVSGSFANAIINHNTCSNTNYVGNIMGRQHTSTVTNIYSLGTINTGASCYAGGLVGKVYGLIPGDSLLTNAYSTAQINATNGNALIGTIETGVTYTVSNVFWSSTLSGKDNAAPGTISGISPIPATFDTNFNTAMPPQAHRDCRNNSSAAGGCIDALNTQNSWDFNNVWAWKTPQNASPVTNPVFRWQCKPYKSNGYDCCKPTSSTESKLNSCPTAK